MDSGAQPLIIGKTLVEELGLTANDLEPYPFTIVTSVGGMERTDDYMKEPLRLIFLLNLDSFIQTCL